MRTRATVAAVALLVVLVLMACGGASSGGRGEFFSSRSEGLSVRYPSGWTLSTANHGYVLDPALCFDISKVTAQEIVDLRIVEYLPPDFDRRDLGFYRARPSRFTLSEFSKGDNDWSPGKDVSFREHRRVFFVGLALPSSADTQTRSQVLQILDSLEVAAKGRCRPTSGVGSDGR